MNKFENSADISSTDKKETIKPISFTREQLNKILDDPEHAPEDILNLLDKDFKETLDAGAGVWEGYSIRDHTLMVMGQFKKYFTGTDIDNRNLFEIILAFHDIGKPDAIAEGDKKKQHQHTKKILNPVMIQLEYEPEDIALAESIIDGDHLGGYLRGGDVTESAKMILTMAGKSGISLEKYWKLLMTYYQVDAGSYTEDAGGLKSLDRLFVFDHESDTMSFAPDIAQKIKMLEDEFRKLAAEAAKDNN